MNEAATNLSITYCSTGSLNVNANNPRVHSKKQVAQNAQSIQSFGFNVPLLIDETSTVIAGHGRLLAAKQLGWEKVPVITLAHLTKAQQAAFLIADNRLTENSTWDDRLLGEQLRTSRRWTSRSIWRPRVSKFQRLICSSTAWMSSRRPMPTI